MTFTDAITKAEDSARSLCLRDDEGEEIPVDFILGGAARLAGNSWDEMRDAVLAGEKSADEYCDFMITWIGEYSNHRLIKRLSRHFSGERISPESTEPEYA